MSAASWTSRATIALSPTFGQPARPRRVEAHPSFMTPAPTSEGSSSWTTTGRSNIDAYSSARRMRLPFTIGFPSSETATIPSAFIEPISASSSPLRPFETAPIGNTRTAPVSRARRTTNATVEASSVTGRVFAIAQTVVKPPAAAARVPEAIVSLYSKPGSRRWAWRSTNPGATTKPAASTTSAPFGGDLLVHLRDDAVPQEDVERLVEVARRVDDASAAQERRARLGSSLIRPLRSRRSGGRARPFGRRRRSRPARGSPSPARPRRPSRSRRRGSSDPGA